MWNLIHKSILTPDSGLYTSVSLVKQRLKVTLLNSQSLHDPIHWTPENFQIKPPIPTYSSAAPNATRSTEPQVDVSG